MDLGLHRYRRPKAWGLLACIGLLAIGACQQQAPPEPSARDKLKQELRPDFEPQKFVSRPNDGVHIEMLLKPGHWSSIDLDVVANRDDARGQLVDQLFDETNWPLDVTFTPFRAEFERPAILPKGQLRRLESRVFCPSWLETRRVAVRMLDDRGYERFTASSVVTLLPPHQWFFVVFAREPDRYRYLPGLDCVAAPDGKSYADDTVPHYRVRMLARGRQLQLAPTFQGWTSTAYALWDDRDPNDLSAEQQQAMLDWLHWGGQLIVSGPETLATLRGSFLEPVLPAKAGGMLEIGTEAFAVLAQATPCEPMRLYRPIAGVELIPRSGGTCPIILEQDFQPPLVVERRVGRGRVVVTAFGLGERKLADWKGLDAFYNACLLRRPARDFLVTTDETAYRVFWPDPTRKEPAANDPALTSQVRYLTRGGPSPTSAHAITQLWREKNPPAEVAAWIDLNSVSREACRALRAAAAIPVPPARFVFWSLALYLLALVPLNWLVFRLMGRVEWAWAAVPVVALAGTAAVVWSTQLNIGFSRALSGIGVIEIQPNYNRAHLTRFTAIYNSLGTAYQLRIDDPTAVALPFFTGVDVLPTQKRESVVLKRGPASGDVDRLGSVSLEGFQIPSNSTGMVRSEQMLPVAGDLRLARLNGERARIENSTAWTILQPMIVSRDRRIPIATLEPGAQCEVSLDGDDAKLAADWPVPVAGLDLRALAAKVAGTVETGQWCLIGVVRGPIVALEIEPAVVSAHVANVVFAHLDYGQLPEPGVDKSCRPAIEPIEPP